VTDFGLEQIIEMHDDVNDVDLRIIRASFCDPYVLVLREDGSIMILELDKKSGELVEMSSGDSLDGEWQAGYLYKPFETESKPLAMLMNSRGSLKVSSLIMPTQLLVD
jgi:cleavage and polyadenylation specificity factor subunit 1